jgi:hypothetical protein
VHALDFDEARESLVRFGGAGPDPMNDTWEFANGVWKRVGSPESPGAEHRPGS